MRHAVLILLMTVLLTACTPAVVPATPSPRSNSPLASPPPTTVPPALDEESGKDTAGKPGGAVIVYERSGGLAGVSDRRAVYPDGRIVSSEGQERWGTEQEVAELLDEVEALGFFEMQDAYGPLNACCDRFIYQITILRGDKAKTVRVVEAEPDIPQEFWRVAELIQNLATE